jgi:hypothetical protein
VNLNLDSFCKGSDLDAFWVEKPFGEKILARNPLMKYAAQMWKLNFRVWKIWPIIEEILSNGEKVVLLSLFPSTVAAVATILSWKCAKDKLCKVNVDAKTKVKTVAKHPIRVGGCEPS